MLFRNMRTIRSCGEIEISCTRHLGFQSSICFEACHHFDRQDALHDHEMEASNNRTDIDVFATLNLNDLKNGVDLQPRSGVITLFTAMLAC
jgi:hypothetical protein